MQMRFTGKFRDLEKLIAVIGISGEWTKRENHNQYRADKGAVLNWWPSTGTVTFQGPDAAARTLKAEFLKMANSVHCLPLKRFGINTGRRRLQSLFKVPLPGSLDA
jgi:hypothetical protein